MKTPEPIKCFLVDLETRERLEFQYNPNDISDEKGTHYAVVRIPGLSHPKYQFVAGEARKIAFTLQLFKGPVRETVAWLQSLLYPEHAGSILKNAPHRVLLVIGELYPGLVCAVRQVKARFFNLFDPATLNPQQAEVELVLEEPVETSIDYRTVRT